MMKSSLLSLCLVLACLSAPAAPKETFSGTSTDISTNLSYYVVSAEGAGAPVVTHIDATSDLTTSVLQFYCQSSTTTQCTNTSNLAATNVVYVQSTNGFASNDVVVIWYKASDLYQKTKINADPGTGTLTLAQNTDRVISDGDAIIKMTAAGSLVIGNTTKNYNGVGLFYGSPGCVLLVEANGTAACQINTIAGYFKR